MGRLENKEDIAIFTICAVNYLAKALVLADSIYRIEGVRTIIYIADRKREIKKCNFAVIKWIEDEKIENWLKLAFMYDITEFSTSIKPILAERLLSSYSKVIFFDPDICLYNNLTEIYNDLERYPILLTPHYITPIESKEKNYDLGMMRFGSFNLGFFGVSNSLEARRFLEWWSVRCIELGFFETQFGLSTDQKWVSIAPCFFPNLHILFNIGLNVAFWNMHERTLIERDGTYWVNNKSKLVFFHFSSFDPSNPDRISKRLNSLEGSKRDNFIQICRDYANRILAFDDGYSKEAYGFDYMNDGEYISPTLRRAYACMKDELGDINPFDNIGRMEKFIKINHLKEKKNKKYFPATTANISQHKIKFEFVYFVLRRLLQILGPSEFSNFSRLLVYLSSYRQLKGLWKLPKKGK